MIDLATIVPIIPIIVPSETSPTSPSSASTPALKLYYGISQGWIWLRSLSECHLGTLHRFIYKNCSHLWLTISLPELVTCVFFGG